MITVKNKTEIAAMQKACTLSAEALQLAGEMVKPGVTTGEIDRAVKRFIRENGAEPSFLGYGGFSGSACISIDEEVIHGIPGGRPLKSGEIVSVDVGAYIGGFHGDNAATFACGEISDEVQRLMDVTRESLVRGIAAAQAGNRVGDIGHAVQSYVEENGFAVVRAFVGHGVGSKLHEEPEVPNYGRAGHGPRLVPGMTIAIEPMVTQFSHEVKVLKDGWTTVTIDGGLAAHFEHTILITADGPVVLTKPGQAR